VERLARDKHSNLLQKFVNYEQKSFITSPPGDRIARKKRRVRRKRRERKHRPSKCGNKHWRDKEI